MRRAIQTAGFVLVFMGISGTIDHLVGQPVFGPFLNAFNRYVVPQISALSGYELYANLLVAVVGVMAMMLAERGEGMTAVAGPAPLAARVLAPDLARGVMLLLIALAHSRSLHEGGYALAVAAAGTPLDTAVQALLTTFVDSRARPMYAVLFGYGLVQFARRRADEGLDRTATRRLLRRRAWWLVAFGLAHTVLLNAGDILAAYGLLALLLVGALRRPDRRIWVVATLFAVAGTLASAR